MKKELIGLCIAAIMLSAIFSGCDAGKGADTDKDGVPDSKDAFPNDPAASVDGDGDGHPDAWNDAWNTTTGDTNLTIDAFPHDPKEWMDSDGDGYGDNGDQFPDDPEVHVIHYILNSKTDTILVTGEVHYDANITAEDNYFVIYWTLDSSDDAAGDAISIKYKPSSGSWSMAKHGLSGEIKRNIADAGGAGQWQVFITNQGHITGYDHPITITYRIYTIQ